MTAKSLRNGIRERKKEVGGKSARCLAHVVLTFEKSEIFFPSTFLMSSSPSVKKFIVICY